MYRNSYLQKSTLLVLVFVRGSTRTLMATWYVDCNDKYQLFAHLSVLHFWLIIAEPFSLSYVPLTLDGRWLRTNGFAHAIHAECRYCIGVNGKKYSIIIASVLVQEIHPFCFAQTNSSRVPRPPEFPGELGRPVAARKPVGRHLRTT